MNSLLQASGLVMNLLFIITALLVFVAVLLTIRRRHITISDVCNGTGSADLDENAKRLSAALRLRIAAQLEKTREAVGDYHEKVRQAPDRCYALNLPDMKNAVASRQDERLASLAASLDTGPSRSLAAQLLALTELVARPRGATVKATIYGPDPQAHRLAIAVEVSSPGARFAQCRVLWESCEPAGNATPAERMWALVEPAARCAAIDLAGWALRRLVWFRARRGGQRRAGLAHNMVGLLMNASAGDFPLFAAPFRQFALEEFRAAADKLPGEYQPHFNLAAAYEAEGQAAQGPRRYNAFVAAVRDYRAAAAAASSLAQPASGAVQRRVMIRLVRAELISGIARLRAHALGWLSEQPTEVALDCRAERSRRLWPLPGIRSGGTRPALDELTADCLYNSACAYALAAGLARGGQRDSWDLHARRLLGTALVLDTGDRYLWEVAGSDQDLAGLSGHLDDFMDHLREVISGGQTADATLPELLQLVDEAATAANWQMSPQPPGPPPPSPGHRTLPHPAAGHAGAFLAPHRTH